VIVAAWHRAAGRVLVTVGLILALLSAVPIHPAIYGLLFVTTAVWLVIPRRVTTLAVLGLVASAALGSLIATQPWGARLSPKSPVFVLGDSISAGLNLSNEGTWPRLLSAKLNVGVTNLAHPGATLASGSAQAKALPPGAGIVLVELGGNDLLGDATPAQFERDLRSLLSRLATGDRRVLMFELPLLPFQNRFGRIQRDVCSQYGVTLLPRSVLAGAIALPGHSIDGLHLSPRGHLWLCERVSKLWTRGDPQLLANILRALARTKP
jgi:acyl-CoA thioesterase-1